jgi:cell division protein FtsZ
MLFEFDDLADQKAKLRVIGVGGGGGNAVNRMIESGLSGVDFVSINTDAQALDNNKAPTKIQIGKDITRGLGTGAVVEIGRKAIEADKNLVSNTINGSDMVFITAGMGGGTGTSVSSIVGEIAKQHGALTVGIVTKPFNFEGPKRMKRAEWGIQELKNSVDTLIVIPNQRLLDIIDRGTTIREAFRTADSVLHQATKGISDLINHYGIINLDFADIMTIMKNMGDAIMGTGIASGEERATLAAQQAITSPLLDEISIKGATGLLINITGGENLNLFEVDEACKIITEEASSEAEVIFGAVIDENLTDEIMITVIATGFGNGKKIQNKTSLIETDNKKKDYSTSTSFSLEKTIKEEKVQDKISKSPLLTLDEEDFEEDKPLNHQHIPAFIRRKLRE